MLSCKPVLMLVSTKFQSVVTFSGDVSMDGITYFLVVVRLPLIMRVEVETDLKLLIPPPMLSIPFRPPKEEEKEVNSTEEGRMIRKGKQKRRDRFILMYYYKTSVCAKITPLLCYCHRKCEFKWVKMHRCLNTRK